MGVGGKGAGEGSVGVCGDGWDGVGVGSGVRWGGGEAGGVIGVEGPPHHIPWDVWDDFEEADSFASAGATAGASLRGPLPAPVIDDHR